MNSHRLNKLKRRVEMFSGKRFVTSGIAEKVPLLLQVIMWDMIYTMDEQKDYLQVFDLSEENGKQKIVHSQEQPEYKREYLFETGTPFLCANIFVISYLLSYFILSKSDRAYALPPLLLYHTQFKRKTGNQ